ncbi:hypothetical protein [Sphingomonas kyeonggiensis]|uniref:Uncharacterized protein n=1 Tax=Sphingomonas kyeonggiensis TaxID=1268553 RepID=A0A7W6NVC0_9SPHN|nr:hypothetical protein [Sphingomonas kyeonggiensis]MBB4097924.1 hypothetical protein [Sphingomonas kyeonggiensis]
MVTRTRWQRCGILAAALLLAPPNAFGCSTELRTMSRAQVEAYARTQYAKASAVVDAEVEQPMAFGTELGPGLMPMAILRVIHRYKGVPSPGEDRIPLVNFSSCDIGLVKKGERVRILLTSGPELFRAVFSDNGPPVDRQDGQAEFNAEIDRLAGAPRPAGFSTYPGAIEPPSDAETATAANAPPDDMASQKTPASSAPKHAVRPAIYLAGAFGLLLAFLAGFLLGRRSHGLKL